MNNMKHLKEKKCKKKNSKPSSIMTILHNVYLWKCVQELIYNTIVASD